MCLVFLGYRINPLFPAVIAGNRDEFFRRNTSRLQQQDDMLFGQDLEAGGTWLGIRQGGKFGFLTNFRMPGGALPRNRSRGELVIRFLKSAQGVREFLQEILEEADQFAPFNLVCGDAEHLGYLESASGTCQLLGPGFYGLSNGRLDEPWPKIVRGKRVLEPLFRKRKRIRPTEIFGILRDRHQPHDTELPDTGVGPEWERLLGPMFIESQEYGTRSSALVLIHRSGRIDFYEQTYRGMGNGGDGTGLVHRYFRD